MRHLLHQQRYPKPCTRGYASGPALFWSSACLSGYRNLGKVFGSCGWLGYIYPLAVRHVLATNLISVTLRRDNDKLGVFFFLLPVDVSGR
jgi:hypothetical protein